MIRGHAIRLAAAGMMAVAAGCSSNGQADETQTDCGAAVVWRGEVLHGTNAKGLELPPLGAEHEVETGCSKKDPIMTTVNELEGVAPELALLELDHGKQYALYLAVGVYVQLPEHPLHTSFYRSAQRPRLDRGRACRPARAMRGKVRITDGIGGYLVVRDDSGRRSWRIEARTRVGAPAFAGVPRIRRGQAVHVSGLRCDPYRLVARTVKVI